MNIWFQIALLFLSVIVFISLITLGALLINRPHSTEPPTEPPTEPQPPIRPPTNPPIRPPTNPPIGPPINPQPPIRPPTNPQPPQVPRLPANPTPEQIRAYCVADYNRCKSDPSNYFCRSVDVCIKSISKK